MRLEAHLGQRLEQRMQLSQQMLQKGRAEQTKATADREAAQNRLARTTDEEREIREKLVHVCDDGSIRLDFKPVKMGPYVPMERKY
mgnify:CR=1 FL=1